MLVKHAAELPRWVSTMEKTIRRNSYIKIVAIILFSIMTLSCGHIVQDPRIYGVWLVTKEEKCIDPIDTSKTMLPLTVQYSIFDNKVKKPISKISEIEFKENGKYLNISYNDGAHNFSLKDSILSIGELDYKIVSLSDSMLVYKEVEYYLCPKTIYCKRVSNK